MRHGVIIACRMSSQRLPGKTLTSVAGRPLLWYVHRRLEALGVPLVIATSDDASDNPIEKYATREGLSLYRGSLSDVAGRMLEAAKTHRLDSFARVNGDSPFTDSRLLKQGFDALAREGLDFVTNLAPRSFPYGVAVEVLRTSSFEKLLAGTQDPLDREHVTRVVYRQLSELKHRSLVRSGSDLSGHQLTIDTPEDLERFRYFVGSTPRYWPSVTFEDAIMEFTPAALAAPAETPRRAA